MPIQRISFSGAVTEELPDGGDVLQGREDRQGNGPSGRESSQGRRHGERPVGPEGLHLPADGSRRPPQLHPTVHRERPATAVGALQGDVHGPPPPAPADVRASGDRGSEPHVESAWEFDGGPRGGEPRDAAVG